MAFPIAPITLYYVMSEIRRELTVSMSIHAFFSFICVDVNDQEVVNVQINRKMYAVFYFLCK